MGNGSQLMGTRDASDRMSDFGSSVCNTQRPHPCLPRQEPDAGRCCADYPLDMTRRRARGHGAPKVMATRARKQTLTQHAQRMRRLRLIIPSEMNRVLSGSRVPDDDHATVAARTASTRDPSERRPSIRTSAPCHRVAMPPAQPDKTCSSNRRRGSRPGMPSGQRSAQPPTRSHAPRDEMPDRNAHARLPHEDVCRPTFPPPHPSLGAWAVETFEAKKWLREDRFSTIRRPIVVLWAKKRRKYGPRSHFCSPEDFCRPRS